MHKDKLALALQALSHAKGHYLAAVSSNRGVSGWETGSGSAPSLQGRTIWQCVCPTVRVCAHTCVRGTGVTDPL